MATREAREGFATGVRTVHCRWRAAPLENATLNPDGGSLPTAPAQEANLESAKPDCPEHNNEPARLNVPLDRLRFNAAGLIPAVAQDWLDGAVLMVAWMNEDSLLRTVTTGEAHYWSRSRQQLWHKGSTSGHVQQVHGLRYDCDADVLLLTVEQRHDSACHTGARSCFYGKGLQPHAGGADAPPPPADALSELFRLIEQRRDHPVPDSYTNRLLDGGDNRILKKIGEESAELVMACKDDQPDAIASEAADLIYHVLVALASHQVDWRHVLLELAQRRGQPRRHSFGPGEPKEGSTAPAVATP